MNYYSPLRYPGGKGKLANYVKLLITKNGLEGGTYAEPFAGGAGVALALLLDGVMRRVIINDVSRPIYSYWFSVLYHTDELIRMIYDTEVTMDEWKLQKQVQANESSCTELELGFSTFFLNRTNISGILTGGVIGGLEQNGKWKIDARYNKETLISRIAKIADERANIELHQYDIRDFIDQLIPDFSPNTLVYFDPPYFVKGRTLYKNHFKKSDHQVLGQDIMKKVHVPWIITYDDAEEINEIYKECRTSFFNLNYSASRRYKGTEIMVYSDSCIPPTENEMEEADVRIKFVR